LHLGIALRYSYGMTTPPDSGNLLTTGMAIWSALGPLVGVLLGASIANRNQRRQWVSSCKKEEYSALISALTKSMMTYISQRAYLVARGPEEQRAEASALTAVGETARNRIFIASTVKRLDVVKRWHDATRTVERDGDLDKFATSVGKLLDEIRDAAIKDIGASARRVAAP
jgi:hypothetical protein